jgi:Tol biopolymer transport system component
LTSGFQNRFPIWSSDSQHVAFQSTREGDKGIFSQSADGGPVERLTTPEPGTEHIPESWYGDTLLFDVVKGPDVSLWTTSIREKAPKPFGGVHSSSQTGATFSRDGRWIAYAITAQDKTSKTAIAVQPFPATGVPYSLPTNEPDTPHAPNWSPNGRELFYDPKVIAFEVVSFTPESGFGPPSSIPKRILLGPPGSRTMYDVASDGRLVGLITAGQKEYVRGPANQIMVILNWVEKLKKTASR